MSERNPFQQNPGQKQLPCEEWEALLTDALDGTLTPESEALFTAHGTNCLMCAEMLAQAKQGREWMQFLHDDPQVPSDLVSKILDRTSGASLPELALAGPAGAGVVLPPVPAQVIRFSVRNSFRDSRILMTAAMAFFSIALTLNLIGIRLDTVRMADLKPSALQTNIARQFFRTKQQMVSYYEGLRLVYELETKMGELRRDTEQNAQPQKNEKPAGAPQGNAHPNGGSLQTPHRSAPVIAFGEPELAAVETPENGTHPAVEENKNEEISKLVVNEFADQAERSLA